MRACIKNSILVLDYAAEVVSQAYDRVLFPLNSEYPVLLSIEVIKLYT